ncbi:MAG TPA: hypothetical protein VF103_09730 [Polyangiaceae bacterium]
MRSAAILGGLGAGVGLVAAGLSVGACSPSSDGASRGQGGASTSAGTSGTPSGGAPNGGAVSGGGISGTSPIIGSGTSGAAGSGDITACAGQVTKGELVPVDMFVMLDISSSMLEMTAAGTDKWSAVKNALHAFLADPGSAGLGVGIQYFPLAKPNVPASCTSDRECGDAAPCFLRLCWGAFTAQNQAIPCDTAGDCQSGTADLGPCQAFGQCSDDRSYLCQTLGLPCISLTQVLGTCVAPESFCINATDCAVERYATPAVAITTLPEAEPALGASIDAQMPDGATPTGPALGGAIQQAQAYARDHANHAVVAVLATDGLPTRCDPVEIPDIGAIAAAAVAASPSVRTFVIGVFGPDDTDAQTNLDTIARGGGTDAAFIIDTSDNVSEQFLAALDEIRGTSLTCEFQIPAPSSGQTLDYGLVNVDYAQGTQKTRLYKVADAAACGSDGGWFYDDASAPTRIVLCPTNCQTAQAATDASVEIQLGCKTDVR